MHHILTVITQFKFKFKQLCQSAKNAHQSKVNGVALEESARFPELREELKTGYIAPNVVLKSQKKISKESIDFPAKESKSRLEEKPGIIIPATKVFGAGLLRQNVSYSDFLKRNCPQSISHEQSVSTAASTARSRHRLFNNWASFSQKMSKTRTDYL